MWKFLKTGAIAALTVGALTTGAQALTVTFGTPSDGELSTSGNTINADWTAGADSWVEFTTDASFLIRLVSFAPDNPNNDVSGFQVYTGLGNSFTGAQYTAFSTCSYGPCVLVTGDSGTNAAALQPGETAGQLAAGTYTFRFNEGSQPTNGTASFVVAPIPLPASAPLLLAGLGAVAFLRRKRKA